MEAEKYAMLEKKLKERRWKKDKLRTAIRESMGKEAEAAHAETEQLAKRNGFLMEIAKCKTENAELEAEYEKVCAEEKKQKEHLRNEMMELRDEMRDQVAKVENVAIDAKKLAK